MNEYVALSLVLLSAVLIFVILWELTNKRRNKLKEQIEDIAVLFASKTKSKYSMPAAPVFLVLPLSELFVYHQKPTKKEFKRHSEFLNALSTFVDNKEGEFEYDTGYRVFCEQLNKQRKEKTFNLDKWENFLKLVSADTKNREAYENIVDTLFSPNYYGDLYSTISDGSSVSHNELATWLNIFVEDPFISDLPIEWQLNIVSTNEDDMSKKAPFS